VAEQLRSTHRRTGFRRGRLAEQLVLPAGLCGLALTAAGLAARPTSTPSKDCRTAPMASSLAAEIHKPPASFDCSTINNGTEVKPRNPVFKKHRCTKHFQTVKQAKTVWDPWCKPKGLFSGHLNFRSICNKHEQLLLESNIDCLGISESWLKQSSPSTLVCMAGYNVFRKDRLKGKGGGVLQN